MLSFFRFFFWDAAMGMQQTSYPPFLSVPIMGDQSQETLTTLSTWPGEQETEPTNAVERLSQTEACYSEPESSGQDKC